MNFGHPVDLRGAFFLIGIKRGRVLSVVSLAAVAENGRAGKTWSADSCHVHR